MLKPNQPLPPIEMPLLQGGQWSLHQQQPREFSLLVFYRGHHCPICRHYLHTLSTLLPEFSQRGIEPIAISADSRQKALQSQNEWFTGDLPLGYDFPIEAARKLGLYISRGRSPYEPELFFEPAIFTVRPDDRLYSIIVQSTPFGRPHVKDLLHTFDHFIDEKYPPYGNA